MNDAKRMLFTAYGLMMSVAVHGMELEKPTVSEKSISKDNIFVWSAYDNQYHAVTEFGGISEHSILQKNDQPHKIYRTQLIIKKKEEGEEGYKYSLKTTQESIDGAKTQWQNLKKSERIVMPVVASPEQYSAMWYRLRGCLDKKKAVLVMDNDNNEYFITHIWDENRDNSKKVRVFDMEQCRPVQVPVLNKKKILLKLAKLEKEVAELQEYKRNILTAGKLQERLDRCNRNVFIAKVGSWISFATLMIALYYACNKDHFNNLINIFLRSSA